MVLLSISVVGEDADPIKNGRARSAPTTRKTAKITYERGRLRMDLGFEGEALIILGFLLGGLIRRCLTRRGLVPERAEELSAEMVLRKLLPRLEPEKWPGTTTSYYQSIVSMKRMEWT